MPHIALAAHDRVLVLGASGWLGRTFLDLMEAPVPILAIASSDRDQYRAWDSRMVRDFRPTVVANFAFVLREFLPQVGYDEFVAANERLTARFLEAAGLPSVRMALTVSSGASVALPLDVETNPYGVLKSREAQAALALASASTEIAVARAWSLSGAYVRRPEDYAFSDFVVQARTGRIKVSARQPTFRRYVSAHDFLFVSMCRLLQGWTGTIDSGGELVEVGSLARLIADTVNPSAVVEREPLASDLASVYASDNESWTEACRELDYEPAGLVKQIEETAAGLSA